MSGRGQPISPKLKATLCLISSVALLSTPALGVSVAAAASPEGGNSFNELARKAQSEEQTTSTATTTTSGESTTSTSTTRNSTKTVLIAVGLALVLLVGIAYVIVRDARRVAPAVDVAEVEARAAKDTAVQMRNRRAKARAARQQRKRHPKKR